jgi:DNA-binding transcriptional ArsR family regulator
VESKERGERGQVGRHGKPDHVESFKALAHEIRLRLLGVLSERTVTPAEFAREYDEPIPNVAYHFRYLRALGWIEMVGTNPAGGSLEHVYRRTAVPAFSDDDWTRLPDEGRRVVASTTADELFGRIGHAIKAGTFTARNAHISWTPLRLDEQGWTEMTKLLESTLEQANEIAGRATDRLAHSKEDGLLATVGLAGFESPRG